VKLSPRTAECAIYDLPICDDDEVRTQAKITKTKVTTTPMMD